MNNDDKVQEIMDKVTKAIREALDNNVLSSPKCYFCHTTLSVGTPLWFNDSSVWSCPDHTGVQELAWERCASKIESIDLTINLGDLNER